MKASSRSRRADRLFRATLVGAGLLSAGLLTLVVAFVAREALPALTHVGPARLVSDPTWHPAGEAEGATFGLAAMLAGSAAVAALALLVAAPTGVLAAIAARAYAPRGLSILLRRALLLLAGIPSVVYGLWGLVVLVPLVRRLAPPGPSLLAASLVLALMIVPTIAVLADQALAAVPAETLRGARALGLGRRATAFSVALHAARGGIATAVVLGAARALGETMAVLMVAGNVVRVPVGLFEPVRTLTANIALEMGYAEGLHRSALFAGGLLLLLAVGALAALAAGGDAEVARRAPLPRTRNGRGALLGRLPSFSLPWPELPPRVYDVAGAALVLGAGALVLGGLGWILFDVASAGLARLDLAFLTEAPREAGRAGGIAPILVSTAWILALSLAAALPLALAAGLLLAELRRALPRLVALVRRALDVLAAVPSVVFGLFGWAFFSGALGLGSSILAGALTLACMLLPLLVRAVEEAFRALPDELRRGAAALGLSERRVALSVLLPAALPALVAATLLGLARAASETAALLFTSGYVARMPGSVLDSGRALSVHVYDLALNVPGGEANAYASALVLVLFLLAADLTAAAGVRALGRRT